MTKIEITSNKGEMVIYTSPDGTANIDVRQPVGQLSGHFQPFQSFASMQLCLQKGRVQG